MQWLQDSNESNIDKLNMITREAGRHFGNRRKEYLKIKFMNFKLTVRSEISGTCIGAPLSLRRVASLEPIDREMRKVIFLQTSTPFCLCGGTI
jgi:hypothetical protein